MKRGSDFTDRLKIAAKRVGGQAVLAEASGVPKGTLASYAQGGSEPNVRRLVALAHAAGVSVNWLATGMEDGFAVGDRPAGHTLPSEYLVIPQLAGEPRARPGKGGAEEEDFHRLAFVSTYLTKRGVDPSKARLVTARGDSMEPTISDGDTLLVDTGLNDLREDSIYCIQTNELIRTKRLQRDVQSGVWVISDNPQYADEHLDHTLASRLHIVGRVIWIGRDI